MATDWRGIGGWLGFGVKGSTSRRNLGLVNTNACIALGDAGMPTCGVDTCHVGVCVCVCVCVYLAMPACPPAVLIPAT